ncbi:MAG: hypothetical protein M1548_06865, partial [Actinobacteria bacterium]|nr:hypothetical protein [Actinomycetota bacterium]
MGLEANCMPTAIGSVPFTGLDHATRAIFKNFPEIPFWPQMPNTSFRENMYVQFTENLPGAVVDADAGRVYFDTTNNIAERMEELYAAYIAGDLEYFALEEGSARGFFGFLDVLDTGASPEIKLLKGHVTGPISLGLAVTDEQRRPCLYNDQLREAILKSLAMNIKWQEARMRGVRPDAETLIFVDEPYLVSYGSAYISLSREDALGFLDEVVSAAEGLVGVHCCGNTDWTLLMETQIDVVSFDAYDYAQSMALYPEVVKEFLERGGILAWGVIPSGLPSPDQITKESIDSLVQRLEDAMELLVGTCEG